MLFILGFSYLKSTPLLDNSRTFYAVYPAVAGLQTGTPVTINGLNVGTVNKIKFKDKHGNLLVVFSVGSDFEFSKSSVAELYDTGIIGGKSIQIIPVFDGGAVAQSGDTLSTTTKPGLTELLQTKLTPLQLKLEDAVSNADSLMLNVNEVLDANSKGQLRETIASLSRLMQSLEKTAGSLNTLISSNKVKLDASLTNIETLTSNFAKISDSLHHANLGGTLKNLETTSENLNRLMSKIERGDGTLGQLVNNEALYLNISETMRELDLLLQDFRLNPKRYVNVSVFGKKQKEYAIPEGDPAQNQN